MKPPDHLSKEAKAVWGRLVNEPAYTGLFAATDMLALEVLCENYVAWMLAKQDVFEYQRGLIKGGKKTKKVSQEQNRTMYALNMTLKTAERTLMSWLAGCGMTPPTRSKTEPPADKIEEEEVDIGSLDAAEIKALRQVVTKRKRK